MQSMVSSLVAIASLSLVVALSGSCTDSPGNGNDSGQAGYGGSQAAAGSVSDAGATGTSGSSSAGASGTASCRAGEFLASLGKDHLLVGASMQDETAAATPFDLRYLYLAGGLFDGSEPCASCATACTSDGTSCDNTAGCNWWGCWQYDQDPPGNYLRAFISTAESDQQIPMLTYYQVLQASGVAEGEAEVHAVDDVAFLTRYLADWRFVLEQIGDHLAFLHIEPDFWGYAEQYRDDPHQIPAAVSTANPTDCSNEEDTLAGFRPGSSLVQGRGRPHQQAGNLVAGASRQHELAESNRTVAGQPRRLFLRTYG